MRERTSNPLIQVKLDRSSIMIIYRRKQWKIFFVRCCLVYPFPSLPMMSESFAKIQLHTTTMWSNRLFLLNLFVVTIVLGELNDLPVIFSFFPWLLWFLFFSLFSHRNELFGQHCLDWKRRQKKMWIQWSQSINRCCLKIALSFHHYWVSNISFSIYFLANESHFRESNKEKFIIEKFNWDL